ARVVTANVAGVLRSSRATSSGRNRERSWAGEWDRRVVMTASGSGDRIGLRGEMTGRHRARGTDSQESGFRESLSRWRPARMAQLPEYLRDPKLPLFLWLRLLTGHRLGRVHRHHLGTQARDPGREVSLYRGPMPEASSAMLAAHLLGKEARPSEVAMMAERKL